MNPQEQEDAKVKKDLQRLGKFLDHQLPFGWGFVFLAFPFGAGGRMNYIANAERADVVRSMYEFIEATREKWSEHIGEAGSGADDEQLARARQELSELKRLLTRAVARIKEKDLIIDRLSQEKQAEASGYFYHQIINLKKLIGELADELDSRIDWQVQPLRGDLLQRARDATKDCTKGD